MLWHGEFNLSCRNKITGLKWTDKVKNSITYPGELSVLRSYFTSIDPIEFYIGLTGMSSLARTTTLVTLTDEVNASEYSRQQITRDSTGWPQYLQDTDLHYQIISKVVSFEATSTWNTVDKLFLATSSDDTGTLISYGPLSTSRTLVENDVLDITYKIKLA